MRASLALAMGLVCLSLVGTPSTARADEEPFCDVCSICGADLLVSLKSAFSGTVHKVQLAACAGQTCAFRDVTSEMSMPMYGGSAQSVTLNPTPTTMYYNIRFEYCEVPNCSPTKRKWVTRTLNNCG